MSRWIMIGLICCAAWLTVVPSQAADDPDVEEKRVTLAFNNAPLSDVIAALFEAGNMSYTLDPKVKDINVTINLKSVTFENAMRLLAKYAGVQYTLTTGVYQIGPRSAEMSETHGDIHTYHTVIRLQYMPSADVAPFIARMPGILNVAATNSNALILEGDPASIEQAEEVIALLDRPESLPRQVEITLDVGVAASGNPGAPGSGGLRASQTVSVAEGLPMTLVLSSGPSDAGNSSEANDYLGLTITLTPAVSYSPGDGEGDDNTTVTLSADAVLTATLNGMQIRREFDPVVVVKPGRTATIAFGTSEGFEGGLTLQLTAKVEVLGWLKLSRDPRSTGGTINPSQEPLDLGAFFFGSESDEAPSPSSKPTIITPTNPR